MAEVLAVLLQPGSPHGAGFGAEASFDAEWLRVELVRADV
jgi:hypothetical protein